MYLFGMSGGMYNIIRETPFSRRGEDGQEGYISGSSREQYGAEGYISITLIHACMHVSMLI